MNTLGTCVQCAQKMRVVVKEVDKKGGNNREQRSEKWRNRREDGRNMQKMIDRSIKSKADHQYKTYKKKCAVLEVGISRKERRNEKRNVDNW